VQRLPIVFCLRLKVVSQSVSTRLKLGYSDQPQKLFRDEERPRFSPV
jgi:hypothetical protein